MPRKEKERRVSQMPGIQFFKPQGIPLRELKVVEINFDELEAMRLCYREGYYQQDAATMMKVSRQTVGRILNSAMAKITRALVEGKAIAITGGNIEFDPKNICPGCHEELETRDERCLDCDEHEKIGQRKSLNINK